MRAVFVSTLLTKCFRADRQGFRHFNTDFFDPLQRFPSEVCRAAAATPFELTKCCVNQSRAVVCQTVSAHGHGRAWRSTSGAGRNVVPAVPLDADGSQSFLSPRLLDFTVNTHSRRIIIQPSSSSSLTSICSNSC